MHCQQLVMRIPTMVSGIVLSFAIALQVPEPLRVLLLLSQSQSRPPVCVCVYRSAFFSPQLWCLWLFISVSVPRPCLDRAQGSRDVSRMRHTRTLDMFACACVFVRARA